MGPLRAPPFICIAPDRVVLRCRLPYPQYVRSDVLLARLMRGGTLQLLSGAWESLLGFAHGSLDGRALLDLLPTAQRPLGEAALRRLLSPEQADPVAIELARRDGTMLRMHCHRRFDPYDATLFIAGEPAGISVAQCRAPSAPAHP
jgi:PAS domain-containing protein